MHLHYGMLPGGRQARRVFAVFAEVECLREWELRIALVACDSRFEGLAAIGSMNWRETKSEEEGRVGCFGYQSWMLS